MKFYVKDTYKRQLREFEARYRAIKNLKDITLHREKQTLKRIIKEIEQLLKETK